MDTGAEIRAAQAAYESALDAIRRAKAGKATAGMEAKLGQSYQRLVRAGAAPQLKWKYRG